MIGLRDAVARTLAKGLKSPLSSLVDDALRGRTFADPAEVAALAARLTAAEARDKEKIAALETEVKALTKKLSMTTGALQAAELQLSDAKKAAEQALALAQRAQQQATSALATAESAKH